MLLFHTWTSKTVDQWVEMWKRWLGKLIHQFNALGSKNFRSHHSFLLCTLCSGLRWMWCPNFRGRAGAFISQTWKVLSSDVVSTLRTTLSGTFLFKTAQREHIEFVTQQTVKNWVKLSWNKCHFQGFCQVLKNLIKKSKIPNLRP